MSARDACAPPAAIALRRTLAAFPTGVIVVTTRDRAGVHGMTANAFTAVALDPPTVLICIADAARMAGRLRRTRRFGLSMLAQDQAAVARHFATRGAAAAVDFVHEADVPLIAGAAAHLVCDVVRAQRIADHTLFIGLVRVHMRGVDAPLAFAESRFGVVGALPLEGQPEGHKACG